MNADEERGFAAVELLPCPFCEGPVALVGYSRGHWIRCKGCGCHGPLVWSGADNAAAAWNRRALTPPLAMAGREQAVEALGEKLFALSDRLRRVGALESDNVHAAYEAVVAAFQRLAPAPDGERS